MLILILEDEWLIGLAAKDLLEGLGHEVAGPAANLRQAIALADERRPDALFTNIHLGVEPVGITASQVFLSRGIPSVFVSGSAEEAQASRCSAIGFLSKPCDPGTLWTALLVLDVVLHGGVPRGGPAGFEIFPEGVARFHKLSGRKEAETLR